MLIVDLSTLPKDVLCELNKGRRDYNAVNVAPTNWRVISEAEFAKSDFFIYLWDDVKHMQLLATENGDPAAVELRNGKYYSMMLTVRIFSYRNRSDGYAISRSHEDGVVFYFRWGCQHKFKELTLRECEEKQIYHGGRSFHVYKCSLCGDINSIDSSD